MVGPSGKPIIGGIYRDAAGLEVRCHSTESVDALIRPERAADIYIAHHIAVVWKQATLEKGFTELRTDL